MDPNLTEFPILSYVMDRLPAFGSKPAFDIEQPSPSSSSDTLAYHQLQESLRAQMPHLNDSEVMKSMKAAISDVVQTRSILQALGERPNHEAVDTALTKIAEMEEDLLINIQEIMLGPKPVGVDPSKWEEEKIQECKQEAEKEIEIYKAVVRLDEMHEAYDNLLRDAENRLEKIYSSVAAIENGKDEKVELEEEVNEEVIAILRQGERGVERLDLSERKLRILPEAFGRLRGLIALNLSSNELKTLPDSIAGLEHLQELNLSSNVLESLPDSIGLLLNLKILDVSSNKLKAIPNTISQCRSLVELNASYNSLVYLPTNIGYELVNLIKLYLQYNKLRSLPSSICEMRSLRYLDAHFNELHGLPYAIGRLTELETLNLGSNFSDLRELPETFGDLVSLKGLDLSNNQIHALPNTFGRLENLVKLNLDQNPIVVPPMEVVSEGVEAVREFMKKRWVEIEEEMKSRVEGDDEGQSGWWGGGAAVLSGWVSMVSGGVTGYFGGGVKVPRDAFLDQQL